MNSFCTIMTCHNRQKELKICLTLLKKLGPRNNHLVLVGDTVKDNSIEIAQNTWGENLTISTTKAPQFWSKSMRIAEGIAKKGEPDFIIWLNEDTFLLKKIEGIEDPNSIVVGTILDEGGEIYRGAVERASLTRFKTVDPSKPKREPDTFHGNLVIIPKAIYKKMEIEGFSHAFGDFFYGLKAKKLGFKITPTLPVAWTPKNTREANNSNHWSKTKGFVERLKKCAEPKGFPPKDWWKFTGMYCNNPLARIVAFLLPYYRILFPTFLDKFRK